MHILTCVFQIECRLDIFIDKEELKIKHTPELPISVKERYNQLVLETSSSITMDRLLSKVINLNIYSRLEELYNLVTNNTSLNITAELTPFNDDYMKNYLKIWLLSSVFVYITVDIRTGKLQLKIDELDSVTGKIILF